MEDRYPDRAWLLNGLINGSADPADSAGSYGRVYRGVPRPGAPSNTRECAVKVMDNGRMTKKDFDREYEIMKYVSTVLRNKDHGSIEERALLELYEGWQEGRQHFVFAVEKLEGGDLYKYINTRLQARPFVPFSEREIRRLLTPIFTALKKLHEHKIVHADLKIENLVFRDAEHTQLVMVDYGLSYQLRWPGDGENVPPLLDGRLHYYPPEVSAKPQVITPALDVYCLGYVLFLLLTGRRYVPNARFPSGVSEHARTLCLCMLQSDYRSRISLEAALTHAWFSVPDAALGADLPTVVIDQDTELQPMIDELRVHERIVIAPGIKRLRETLDVSKQTILESLAALLKQKKQKHESHKFHDGQIVTLNSVEFIDMMPRAGLPFLASQAIFDQADLDGNGAIDYREITLLLRTTNIFTTKQIVENFCFKVLDTDGDESLSLVELAAALSNMLFQPHNASPTARGGGGGGVSDLAEPPTLTRSSSSQGRIDLSTEAVEKLLLCIDTSGDGLIQKEEFCQWVFGLDDDDGPAMLAKRQLVGALFSSTPPVSPRLIEPEEAAASSGGGGEESGGGGDCGGGGGGGASGGLRGAADA